MWTVLSTTPQRVALNLRWTIRYGVDNYFTVTEHFDTPATTRHCWLARIASGISVFKLQKCKTPILELIMTVESKNISKLSPSFPCLFCTNSTLILIEGSSGTSSSNRAEILHLPNRNNHHHIQSRSGLHSVIWCVRRALLSISEIRVHLWNAASLAWGWILV